MRPNYTYNVTVCRVLDGDTLDVSAQLWQGLTLEVRIRLAHVDAPEVHSTDENEKRAGVAAKISLDTLLGGNEAIPFPYDVTVTILKQDKFGRWLAEVFTPQLTKEYIDYFDKFDGSSNAADPKPPPRTVNDWMIQQGHARPYEGGARTLADANPFNSDSVFSTPAAQPLHSGR